ncbi:DUF2964 family protein [Paraburkholderia phymatum]|uniref:DUF2964 family protein n=1 Tax=Paraburkholderia phymatum TaxID=148447 RepID=UPI0005A0D951|nr:DUF2964 family protein [Paraburkholderia phymatum]
MLRQRLRLILLKLVAFIGVGGPLAAIAGSLSAHDKLIRYAAAAAVLGVAAFVLLLKSVHSDDA